MVSGSGGSGGTGEHAVVAPGDSDAVRPPAGPREIGAAHPPAAPRDADDRHPPTALRRLALPRLVIAGTGSGVGKTTVACGLIAALRARGEQVQGFKVGPDYIDPSYHALASGRPGRNLDAYLAGPEMVAPLLAHGAAGATVAVVEGVMGMFDGASGRGELASTAHVAKLVAAPVLLVVDAQATARSVAAIVHGFRTFDPAVRVAGVIFNRVGSPHHEQLLREAVAPLGVPVVGALPRDPRLATPERHLGLIPAGEREAAARRTLAELGEALARHLNLELAMAIARSAPPLDTSPWSPGGVLAPGLGEHRQPVTVAVAGGPAFSFLYRENLELLAAAGVELAAFDPARDEELPAGTAGLLLAGGFPERYSSELAANARLRAAVRDLCAAGAPVLAECGGLLYLCESLDGKPMCGVIPARAWMTERLTLGYREAQALARSGWLAAPAAVRGHEFHYSQVEPADGDQLARALGWQSAWLLRSRSGERREGFVRGGVHASYLHTHWAAFPEMALRFAGAVRAWASAHAGAPTAAGQRPRDARESAGRASGVAQPT